MRYLAILIALLCMACSTPKHGPSAKPPAKAPAAGTPAETQAVQRDVERIIRAIYSGDVDLVMHSTYPGVIGLMGGADVARRSLEAIVAQVRKSGMTLESFSFPEPPEFFTAGGTRYVFVPTLSVVAVNGKRFESRNFQLGVLEAGATRWTYVEGSRLTPQNVHQLLPAFPSDRSLPPIHRKAL
jgi:hypothetical protein